MVVLICFCSVLSRAQSDNICDVKAVISPGDTVLAFGEPITFTSNSINATSIKWQYSNHGYRDTNQSYSPFRNIGLHKVSLVATNGVCTDTAFVQYYILGQAHDVDSFMLANYGFYNTADEGYCIDDAADGGFVMGGFSEPSYELYGRERGLIIKTRDRGCIDWSKFVTYSFNSDIPVKTIYAAKDGSYYAAGRGFLLKLDKNGNTCWSRQLYDSKIPGSRELLHGWHITDDPDNNVYFYSGTWGRILLIKFDSSGTPLWNKLYKTSETGYDLANGGGITYLDGKLYLSANIDFREEKYLVGLLMKINPADGNKEWQYAYKPSYQDFYFGTPSIFKDMIMVNANLRSNGGGVVLFDQNGKFWKGIGADFPAYYGKSTEAVKAEADENGNIFIMQLSKMTLPLQPYFRYHTNFVRTDTLLRRHWAFTYAPPDRGFLRSAALNKKGEFGGLGTEISNMRTEYSGSYNFRFIKLDTDKYEPPNFCYSMTESYTLMSLSALRMNLPSTVDTSLELDIVPHPYLRVSDAYSDAWVSCPDYVDSCHFLRVTGPTRGCNYNNTYTFEVAKNNKCAFTPKWEFPENTTVISQLKNKITVKFPGFGRHKVFVSLASCVPIADTLIITLTPPPVKLELGADTSICVNTSIKLQPGKGFASYEWQDGSSDSILTVTTPGLYWVQATDSCGNPYRDSITINQFNNAVSIGPDRIKCNNDTLHLIATDGFINYMWSNDYNISSVIERSVVINPLVDTVYFLAAEKLPGCFAYDTIRIHVNTSPPINLGPDVNLCIGDTLMLDAGPGFAAYKWNDGELDRKNNVFLKGRYSVMATTTEGCNSYDTIEVAKVFALPLVNLDKDDAICIGEIKTLDAGNYINYRWNDGSTARTLNVKVPGIYSVIVTDQNECEGSDTTEIRKMYYPPQQILPSDTSICIYGMIELLPLNSYRSYLWNNGSMNRSIEIDKPGKYWLQVEDENNCVGRDTIHVIDKQCLTGFYVPTAFTPNADGKNDTFKPMLYGRVTQYSFNVYNRWGQLLFRTTDVQKGWTGVQSGKPQSSTVYIWTCTYKFESQPVKTEKGTVLMIK